MAASMSVNSPITSKLSVASFRGTKKKQTQRAKLGETAKCDDNIEGNSIAEKRVNDREFSCTPHIVEFRRLLQRPKYNTVEAIPGVSNRDILHAAIALYDNCLPDITPEVLYSTVCEKWATTLLLVRSNEDVVRDYKDGKTMKDGHCPTFDRQTSVKSSDIDLFSLEYHQINGDSVDPSHGKLLPSGDTKDINCNTRGSFVSPSNPALYENGTLGNHPSVYAENSQKPVTVVDQEISAIDGAEDDGAEDSDETVVAVDLETEQTQIQRVQDGDGPNSEHICRSCGSDERTSNSQSDSCCDCPDKQDLRTSPEGEIDDVREGEIGPCGLEGSGDRKEEGEAEKRGRFADVFSDTESDDSSSSEEEDENFSEGADLLLKLVKERREKRRSALETGGDITPFIGIESRLVGCATWERSQVCPGETTIQIDLLAVRRRYRRSGVGRYLLQKLKDPSMVGRYDALVVYADHSAVEFFSGHGFSDDIVLNSKYSELADNWTNCTLMCHIPPFTGQFKSDQLDGSLDLKLIELEVQKWTLKSREAYQAQMSILMRLRHEIIALQALVSSQKEVISSLSGKLDQLHVEKLDLEKKNLLQRIVALKAGVDLDAKLEDEPDTGYHEWDECEGGEEGATLDSSSIINDLERRLHDLGAESDIDGDEELIDWTVAEEFTFAMREDPTIGTNLTVLRTKKAHPSEHTISLHLDWCQKLNDPSMKTRMYFSGGLTHPERINTILENGFSSLDFACGEYGTGLYFSQHPSTAANFSALGKILLAEVAIGKSETITQEDRTRTAPSRGFDSIITQGRLRLDDQAASDVRSRQQEYVIFHPSQALPLYLVEYKIER